MAEPTLAKRLVQHPVWGRDGFGWARGMVCVGGAVCLAPSDPEGRILFSSWEAGESYTWTADPAERDIVPDIEHPATKGCLLEQGRRMLGEATGGVWLRVDPPYDRSPWHACTTERGWWAATEGAVIAEVWLWLADRIVEQEAG